MILDELAANPSLGPGYSSVISFRLLHTPILVQVVVTTTTNSPAFQQASRRLNIANRRFLRWLHRPNLHIARQIGPH